MAYQSKYTGLQIDDILDSVEWKQGKIEDLASIRAGAAKGATALQSYTEKYTGTVTGIKINGETKSGSGIIDLGTISTDISGKQDKLVDGVNIATINGQSLTDGGDLTIESGAQSMVSTTWAELKDMRDSASLVAGTWYRITDYVTTTSQQGTRSLEHPFDVVVLATGENTLSEEARVVRHTGDISMSVRLLGTNFFYKGIMIVDGVEWFEFENTEVGASLVTSSATPDIGDIVYPYYDGTIATDEGYPIESVSESENEYFLNNKANLDAWKIWYCLDNDKKRFPWSHAKTGKSIMVQANDTPLTAEYNGTYEYEGIMYYRWDASYSGLTAVFLTVSDNLTVGDTTDVFGILEFNWFDPQSIPILQVNEASDDEGLGVIYRMIDERGNDCPYDFKNIQFLIPVLDGQFDGENGTEEWVFTFNSNDGSTSTDYSNTSYCLNNLIKSSLLLNFNIFLTRDTNSQCDNNTLGNDCMYNIFNDSCYNNTLETNCSNNTFNKNCYSNTLETNCSNNTFNKNCYSNTLETNCSDNIFDVSVSNCKVASDIQYKTIPYSSIFSGNVEVHVSYNNGKLLIGTLASAYDTEMSSYSTNTVQNKVIKSYIDSNCNIPVITTNASSQSLDANTYYKWTNTPTSITITLTTPTNANILNNYMFEFTASSSGCTLSVPSSIKWLNEIPPVIEPGKTYQISIINNLATVAKFG